MMNKIFSVAGLCAFLVMASCQKDDTGGAVEARPHADVYAEDIIKIDEYLDTHYIKTEDLNSNGKLEVTEVTFGELDDVNTVPIRDHAGLTSKIVKLYGVEFKVYYLKLDTKGDTEADGKKPCGVDRVWVNYKGNLLDGTQFDIGVTPTAFNLIDVVKGWEYIMPQFRAGTFDAPNGDGTANPVNYGSGVMFLPSGLGYYNQSFNSITAYAPLIFTFNLLDVNYLDQDTDKIESRYEYVLNADGTLLDTDGDGVPNVFDGDDDGDGYMTRDEIKIGDTYPAFDDILNCSGTTGGVKKHLDTSCY